MTAAFVQTASGGTDASAQTTTVTFVNPMTVGNKVLCVLGWYKQNTQLPSSISGGGAWVRPGPGYYVYAAYGSAISVGVLDVTASGVSSINFTLSSAAQYRRLTAVEWSGMGDLDQFSYNEGVTANTSQTSSTITTTTDNQHIVSLMQNIETTAAPNAGANYTLRGRSTGGYDVAIEDRDLAAHGNVNAQWITTGTNSFKAIMAIASFKEKVVTPTGPKAYRREGGVLVPVNFRKRSGGVLV